MGNKRYYWFKMKEDFFSKHNLLSLCRSSAGSITIIIYIKLILLAMNNGGLLKNEDNSLPENRRLAMLTDMPLWKINRAMKKLTELGLIRHTEDGSLMLTRIDECTGSETTDAARKRKNKKGQSDGNGGNFPTDKDKDILDKDREGEPEKNISGTPTLNEIYEYAKELGSPHEAQSFYDFYSMRNWSISNQPIHDWKAALRIWMKRKPVFDKYEGRKQYVDDGIEFYFGEDN